MDNRRLTTDDRPPNGQTEIAGFFKLAEGMAEKQFEKQMDEDAQTLKKVLEGD
jgi:hypothetical protein